MVGVNVRTVGSFWGLVKYSLTLPAVQDSIHILPIWEPGVISSLYGPCSWELNKEFFSEELRRSVPALDTVEKQLQAAVDILHAGGRSVGMDVIPHTDRFSETALAFPEHFEWLRRRGSRITDHREHLHEAVQEAVFSFLMEEGPAAPREKPPRGIGGFFSASHPEAPRLRLLFGAPDDPGGRRRRREALVGRLFDAGLETVPATMAPPFRGLRVAPGKGTVANGRRWRDYEITRPTPLSRVFNPLARYKLYGRKDDNRRWEVDFGRPRKAVWDYVCGKYAGIQRRYGFDFMRGDMSHVQMRPSGVPRRPGPYYDILKAVKQRIRRGGARHFAYFAESFLAGKDAFGYGEEPDHLEAAAADAALGDLQSTRLGSPEFLRRLRGSREILETRELAPSFTIITADKDDPRFDGFYAEGSALRLFMGLFLHDMPSYMSLGYEIRDIHPRPAPPEFYSKHYVFLQTKGPQAVRGPYRWGRNRPLFEAVTRTRLFGDRIREDIMGKDVRWLLPPDPAAGCRPLAWTQAGPRPKWLFLANTGSSPSAADLTLPSPAQRGSKPRPLRLAFSTAGRAAPGLIRPSSGGTGLRLRPVGPGEGRVYRVL